ncbi:efflux RND transporter periplasmic adaptor subunit [Flavobacterium cellulosilyticum]|uniref:HlyD family efflux transporter periplasmic adaptor subunit n=1 Tax=Flavobacterium cellulosilyticum TaxID=2541731 RepID=A0A4V2YZ71_9FLAO|nr:efflux RND transporter periplasmic adaptor subunit [Flavobacterium cellulosilyticum]TDD95947.1 HlyD family efflux transporter periplasmic adaptor subunit [Flavobacterium cellulosilyticum]
MKSIIGVQMTNTMTKFFFFLILIPLLFIACKKNAVDEKPIDVSIPVTITSIDTTGIENTIELNATATYLVKNSIKANATGYLSSVNVAINDFVNNGATLFSIKTRESKVLGNTINKMDPSLNFGGAIRVHSNTSGIVTMVNVQQGDYVQDGDPLVTINDASSFALVLSLPYELKKYIAVGQQLKVALPDGSSRMATVQKFSPTVDASSQTQNVVLKINGKRDIPENLIVKVRINKTANTATISLPKAAVLSDETQTDFWIMKLINTNTAIKIPIEKGIQTEDRIEIISPILTKEDKILLTGNYGVADTIKVKVIKK